MSSILKLNNLCFSFFNFVQTFCSMDANGESLKRERKEESFQEMGHRDKVMVWNEYETM